LKEKKKERRRNVIFIERRGVPFGTKSDLREGNISSERIENIRGHG
jgi:hypothetical protein